MCSQAYSLPPCFSITVSLRIKLGIRSFDLLGSDKSTQSRVLELEQGSLVLWVYGGQREREIKIDIDNIIILLFTAITLKLTIGLLRYLT